MGQSSFRWANLVVSTVPGNRNPMHSVTFLFSNAKCREVPTIGVIKLLFECSLANSTSPFGIVRNCKGSYSQLKIRFFEKQFHYSDNPKDFHSPEGLLGIKSTTKKPIWIILTKYPKNGEPGIFKKVPRDKKFFSMKFLKIWKNILVLWNFLLWPCVKKSLKVPTN